MKRKLLACCALYSLLVSLRAQPSIANLDTGIAVTRFSGHQQIVTHRIDSQQFELAELRAGVLIRTLNARTATVEVLTDNFETAPPVDTLPSFYDTDNYWDNANAAMDEIATDLHWGTEMSFDYFWQVHGWLGIDNVGGDINTIAHLGEDWDEAFYLPPPLNFLGYGDGGPLGPNVTLDVVAHEYTHAVVRYAAGLAYLGESSILDEGLADIFSVAVKFFVGLPQLERPWDLAEQLGTFRSMSDPKSQFQPDTYKGEYWYDGDVRTIFAHQNNGVITYWYYLLSEGGSGINDHGLSYAISPIGMDKATKIVFSTMRDELSPLSDFFDFKSGTLNQAAQLYGAGSVEWNTINEAWDAVGVIPTVASSKDVISTVPKISVQPDRILLSAPGGSLRADYIKLIDLHGREMGVSPSQVSETDYILRTDQVRGGVYLLRYGASRAFTQKVWVRK